MKRFYETYVEHFKQRPNSVLEIGSRDGDDAEALRWFSNIPPENVYVVEPHPDSFRRIIQKYPRFRVFELAVSDQARVLDFNAIPYTQHPAVVGTSSLLKRNRNLNVEGQIFPERWVRVLSVTGKTILELINRSQIDLVKIDVEGLTYEVISSFGEDIRLLKALHLEVEFPPLSLWENQRHYAEVAYHMRWFGFEEKYYDGKYWYLNGKFLQGDSVWVRKP